MGARMQLRISAKTLGAMSLPDFCPRCVVNQPVACCLQRAGTMIRGA